MKIMRKKKVLRMLTRNKKKIKRKRKKKKLKKDIHCKKA
jgi:hypothetical protein